MSPRKLPLVVTAFAGALAFGAPSLASAAPSPSNQVKGSGGNTGVGVTLGDIMGFSLKHFFSAPHALQFGLGWGPLHFNSFRVHIEYLWHPGTLVQSPEVDLVPFLGFGTGIAIWSEGRGRYYCNGRYCDYDRGGGAGVGMPIPIPSLGLALHWQKAPVDTTIQGAWSPMIVFPNSNHGSWFQVAAGDIMLGARYYF